MLILSRREGEEIVIGGNTVVRIVAIKGSIVTLAIEAPRSVTVDRMEVHLKRQEKSCNNS